eukprot:8514098-Pyramimonas_sp.AAC.1
MGTVCPKGLICPKGKCARVRLILAVLLSVIRRCPPADAWPRPALGVGSPPGRRATGCRGEQR